MSRASSNTKNRYDSESSDEGFWAGDYSSDAEDSNAQQQLGQTANNSGEMTDEQYMEEAPIQYDTARFWFSKRFQVNDLYDMRTGNLKNEGKILLSLKAGDLQLSNHSNPEDFEVKEQEFEQPTPQQTPLDARRGAHRKPHSHHQRKYKPRRKRVPRDLFKSAHLRGFTSTWDGPLGVALPTVSALAGEGFHAGSEVVSQVFAHNEISSNQPRDYEIRTRPVTKGMVVFNNRYGGQTVDSYKKDVVPLKATKEMMVPFGSPWVMYHNASDPQNAFHGPSAGLESQNMIRVPQDMFHRSAAITDREMKSKLSMADVTDDLQLEFFVPMETGLRVKEHVKFLESEGKSGIAWDNFADHKSQLSTAELNASLGNASTTNNAISDYRKKEFFMRGFLEIKYLRCNGRQIAMNTKKI